MRKLLFLSVMLTLMGVPSWAQKTVSGKVRDDKGNPIANASVLVRNTRTGTVTNEDGSLSLSIPPSARVLVISYADMGSKEVNIGNESFINVTLNPSDKALENVVVVGYGTQRRQAVTASISKINGSEISNLPVPSVDKQLAGKAAGVNVTLGTGLANAEPRIRIRGVNSISGSRDPLVVIDNVPTFSGGLSGVANSNPLADINPNDIESVEILKDGAATAIYGSRAANGVILITTKKGRAGQSKVNYDMYMGMSKAFRTPDLLNAQEFVTIANEKLTNAGLPIGAKMNNENTNTDWLGVVFRDAARAESHTLSFS